MHFKDGISLIEAFNGVYKRKSSKKLTELTANDQKWQIWKWKRNDGHERHKSINQWEDYLQIKSTFVTKDDFWRSYNEVNGFEFGLMTSHFNYFVFKEGIKPMWEDSANNMGGQWVMEFPGKEDWRKTSHLNEIWIKLLLDITGINTNNGSLIEFINDINGVALMFRHHFNKIAVWTQNSSDTVVNLKIGQALKSLTGFNGKMYYAKHNSRDNKIVIQKQKKTTDSFI
ncbi:eukaryotic translation initiation factor 4E-3-like [Oppia nitens]|uniref:eukaryotic translation initiation factor 4E-3-like n=1 Tax=Oppia nitens TaxID=1686743 RepID=UPI0023DAA50E|nr:eukaryotic translation initiation factor 4E-3-like [Oppia nitens]XP_054161944.1 eukaryotic translation initiation factor 4E-3-like [Oppia nitens]